jgi:two-component system sensor histidine kinase BarA
MIYEQGKSLDMVILGGYLPDEHPELWQQIHQLSEQLDSSNLVLLNTNDAEQQQALRKLGYKHLLEKPVTRKKLYDALFDGLSVKQNIVSSQSKNIQANLNRKLRILCVDDNPSNLKLIDAFLNEYPVETTLASSGHEAIASCRKNDFDLIFMDIQMPDMDGVETTAEIRKLKPGRKLPVVAITAHALKGEKEKLLASGLDDYLTKPIDQLQLEAILSKWAGIEFTTDTPPKLKDSETDEHTEKTQNTDKSDDSLCIDWNLSLKKAGGKDDLAVDMLRMLVASFDDTVQSIDSAFKNNDRQQLLAQVHKLHGATAYCGVPRLKQIAYDYETELKNESDLIDLQPLHLSLLSEIKTVTQEAQKILPST